MSGPGLALAGLALLLLIVELRFPLHWIVEYKEHRIRFQNHVFRGERLFIDGKLAELSRRIVAEAFI